MLVLSCWKFGTHINHPLSISFRPYGTPNAKGRNLTIVVADLVLFERLNPSSRAGRVKNTDPGESHPPGHPGRGERKAALFFLSALDPICTRSGRRRWRRGGGCSTRRSLPCLSVRRLTWRQSFVGLRGQAGVAASFSLVPIRPLLTRDDLRQERSEGHTTAREKYAQM